jgi:hypothetical protein
MRKAGLREPRPTLIVPGPGEADSDMSLERLPSPTATAAREANGCRGRPARGRSPCMKQGHVRERTRRAGTKAMLSRPARGGRASGRRKAPQPPRSGGWEVVPTRAPGGVGAPRARPATREEKHGQDRVLFFCEKKAARPCVPLYLWSGRVQSVHGQPQLVFVRV